MKVFVSFFIFVLGCQKISSHEEKQTFIFLGLPQKDVILYQIKKEEHKKNIYFPIMKITTNTKITLPKGEYLLANDCSSYAFQNDGEQEQKIVLSRVRLSFANKKTPHEFQHKPHDHVFNSFCYDPIDGKEHWHTNRADFDILPGKNTLSISGREMSVEFEKSVFADKVISLWPLTLSSPLNTDSSKFFSLPLDLGTKEKKFVISAPVNGTVWLQNGKYQIEVNGSSQILNINESLPQTVQLGVIRISSPQHFPNEARMRAGGQPIFAYINEKVLFRLNTDYPVFPGKYRVTLEGTEIEKNITVGQNEVNEIKTRGAMVLSPSCQKNQEKCRPTTNITIHTSKMPFVLMNVVSNMPFLVFDQKYEYGIEGIKGIFKNLNTSENFLKIDKLGRVKIKWETRYTSSSNTKTDFVRFEAKGSNVFGKSIDLIYFKPDEIFLPEGEYWLSYFVGDQTLILPKTKSEVIVVGGSTKEVSVPLYTQKLSENPFSEKGKSAYSSHTTLSPLKD